MRLDLKTRLDLRVESQFLAYRKVGRYHGAAITTGGWGAQAFGANQLYGVPFHVPEDTSFDRIACEITVGVVGNARIGIYRDNGFVYPGALVLDSGAIDTSVVAVATIIINVTLRAGLYWLTWLADSNPTIRQVTQLYIISITGAADPTQQPGPIFQIAQAYGALPDPFPVGAGYIWSDSPGIFLRRSS